MEVPNSNDKIFISSIKLSLSIVIFSPVYLHLLLP